MKKIKNWFTRIWFSIAVCLCWGLGNLPPEHWMQKAIGEQF